MNNTQQHMGKMRVGLVVGLIFCTACIQFAEQTSYAFAQDECVVVSLGDSYSSGEGNEPFYGQRAPNKYKDPDWLAHRSMGAWPGLLVVPSSDAGIELSQVKDAPSNNRWLFSASSGATINDLKNSQKIEYSEGLFSETVETQLDPQLKVFENIPVGVVDYVTITIGGNDLGFKDVIEAAVKDIGPLQIGNLKGFIDDAWIIYEDRVKDDLIDAYASIQEAAGNQALVIVAGYPTLINEDGCFGLFSSKEAEMINRAVKNLNEKISGLIKDLNHLNLVFVDVADYFKGFEAYTATPYINDIMFHGEQDLKQKFISAYSLHPNEKGQEAYAKAVQVVINEISTGMDKNDTNANSDLSIATSLVFDVSTSMDSLSAYGSNTKLNAAIEQGSAFINSVESQAGYTGSTPTIGVVSFSNSSSKELDLSKDYRSVVSAIQSLHTIGSTNIYAGLNQGIQQLEGSAGHKLMVLLSDGKDTVGNSDTSILSLARDAADRGIKIYTIGFGASSDLNEDLLQQIAAITGGEYAHEDPSQITSAAVSIFAMMIRAQLSANSQILTDHTDTVAQGMTSNAGGFTVEDHGDIQTILYWPGSTLDLELVDPDGITVDDSYPGYTLQSNGIPTQVHIEEAKEGEWKLSVYGADVSMAEEPYYVITAFDETEAPQPTTMAGGGSQDDGTGLLLLVVVVLICAIGGLFAFTIKSRDHEDKGGL